MTSICKNTLHDLPKDDLRQAFEAFNQMSQQLSDSYIRLENQVQMLTGELAEVSAARMKELKEKEQLADRLHALLQLLPGGVVLINSNGIVEQSNPAACNMLHTDTLNGHRWIDIINRYFQPREDDGHEVSLKNGKRLSIQTTSLETEPGQIVLMIDQTETRQLQDKLARHQRLTAMGKMVASLAHQIRTPLSGAMLYAQQLGNGQLDEINQLRFSKKLTQQLKNIESQVRDMLIFARGSAPLNQIISFNELAALIDESKRILSNQYQADIQIQVPKSAGKIQCHVESFIGAIQNLISNGIEAAQQIGKKAKIVVKIERKKQRAYIRIFDNGPGIQQDINDKLIEPFFTTKANGTGLGLPVVNAVIRAHHGRMLFGNQRTHSLEHDPVNRALRGACFTLELPISTETEKLPTGELAHV